MLILILKDIPGKCKHLRDKKGDISIQSSIQGLNHYMKKRMNYFIIKDTILEGDKTAMDLWAMKNITAKYTEQKCLEISGRS